MNVSIKLIILHLNLENEELNCLLFLDNIIQQKYTLDAGNISICLRKILSSFLEIDPEWVKFYLVDVKTGMESLDIYYSCLIPQAIKNKKGKWINVGKINDDIKEIVFLGSQKIY
jgi:oligoribonuclease (3'-5' exoribonuclease)